MNNALIYIKALIIKTILIVFSFPNAFLSFKKQEPKKETKK